MVTLEAYRFPDLGNAKYFRVLTDTASGSRYLMPTYLLHTIRKSYNIMKILLS
jgi:hypothetical protein